MPHIHEKIDFVADTYIVHKNRVLLRIHDKYKVWLPPGGHIEPDEDPNQAAIREAKEEVNLDIQLVAFGFFAVTKTDQIQQGSREISDQIHWFTDEELDDPKYDISERIKNLARTALKELSS